MRIARYFAVGLGALALAGCGEDSKKSGSADLERTLAEKVERTTGTRDVTVHCPEDAKVCDVSAPGGLKAKVTRRGEIVAP